MTILLLVCLLILTAANVAASYSVAVQLSKLSADIRGLEPKSPMAEVFHKIAMRVRVRRDGIPMRAIR